MSSSWPNSIDNFGQVTGTGATSANAALTSLIAYLASIGILTDSTT